MGPLLAFSLGLVAFYGFVCALTVELLGDEAPAWLRWPRPVWQAIAHGWRTPAPAPAHPDYAKIARLERELGLIDVEPERPIRAAKTVCLTKNCMGETHEIRTWSGMLARRIHECES
ncbi:hypothetical protein [Streptomyces sp. WAC08401]|uniref:hypothetical protein n=1 Tax=Streptomyces sp. WAC08401 TaxID=2487413 RepID=UPI000FC0E5C7|nr:hypothetical protein [Streptomyces sp. WAC08401]RSS11432.1 hypothetical protein EF915_25115 [Streptomyces sp. WAC08401]